MPCRLCLSPLPRHRHRCLVTRTTEHGIAARAHDQSLGRQRAATRTRARRGIAGRRARGSIGRGGDGSVYGRTPHDGSELVEACDDRGYIGGNHQLFDRHELGRG